MGHGLVSVSEGLGFGYGPKERGGGEESGGVGSLTSGKTAVRAAWLASGGISQTERVHVGWFGRLLMEYEARGMSRDKRVAGRRRQIFSNFPIIGFFFFLFLFSFLK